ncbi:hypothetical protein D3C85_1662000 [compost metagenome]
MSDYVDFEGPTVDEVQPHVATIVSLFLDIKHDDGETDYGFIWDAIKDDMEGGVEATGGPDFHDDGVWGVAKSLAIKELRRRDEY